MKKINVLVIAITFGLMTLSLNSSAQSMIGVTVIPKFSGPAFGVRQWTNQHLGWGIEGESNWSFDFLSARARLMYGFHTSNKVRYYTLLSGGYMVSLGYDFSAPSAVAGIGAEWLLGFQKNMGIGIEVGYQYGEYNIAGESFTMEPIYIGGSFTYYFKKHKKQ